MTLARRRRELIILDASPVTLHEVKRLLQRVGRVVAGVERQRAQSNARQYPRILVDALDRVQHRLQRLNPVFGLRVTNVATLQR